MSDTSIQWTDKTWNPVRGCSLVSTGCRACYAMKQAHRFNGPGLPYEGLTKIVNGKPVWTGEARPVPDKLTEPLSWRKPQKVFVNSMSDLFHKDVPDEFIDRVFVTMARAPRHTFQILTKRPDRMLQYMHFARQGRVNDAAILHAGGAVWYAQGMGVCGPPWPLPNVWLGVSVEDQKRADERIPLLLQTPAAVRFISAEPLLGPVNLRAVNAGRADELDALNRNPGRRREQAQLDWVIVGGESGPGARPFQLDWARSIQNQCDAAGVPMFMKQAGSAPFDWDRGEPENYVPPALLPLGLKDRKGGDLGELPACLRVRQFPAALQEAR